MSYYKKLQDLGTVKTIGDLHVVELPVNTTLYRASADGKENTDNWFGINWFGINLQDVKEYGSVILTYKVDSPIKIILLDNIHNVDKLAEKLVKFESNNYDGEELEKFLKTGWGDYKDGTWNRNTEREYDYITVAAIGSLVNTEVYDGIGSGKSDVGQKHHAEIALFNVSKLRVSNAERQSFTEQDASRNLRNARQAKIKKARNARKEARKEARQNMGGVATNLFGFRS